MFAQIDWSRRLLGVVLALLVTISASLMSAAGLFDPMEDALTTWRAKSLTVEPTGETVIVEIDARSLAELRTWPWPRRYHAQAVRKLHEAGASVIAFDVDFSARSDSGDAELTAAIREAGHVILPIFEQRSSGRQDDQHFISSRPDAAFSDAWVGGVNIFPDHDGVVREYPAATYVDGAIQPSIATLLAEKDGLGDRSFEPDWAIDANRIPRHSFVDVMEGRVPGLVLRGKRVLIGATAVELGDRHAVPRYGMLPGVVIQALAAETLLQDRPIQRSGFPVTLVGVLLIALLLAPRPIEAPARYLAISAMVIFGILAIPLVGQQHFAIAIDSSAWLFTAVAVAGLQAVVEVRRRLRLRAEFDADSGLRNRSMLEKRLDETQVTSPVLVAAAIERFEAIRDGIGLQATNELIRKAGDLIEIQTGGPVYRVAPDVLAWLMPREDRQALQVLNRIQSSFREPVATTSGPVDVVLTLGLAKSDAHQAAVLLIEHALSAIRGARSQGKRREWYSGSDPLLRCELSMMGELRRAMEKGCLALSYQPKMSLATGKIADAEALIRWSNADGHSVPPDKFIPLAEATGVIHEVTNFALQAAVADLRRWAQDGLVVRAAVNVSALDLAASDFAAKVMGILRDAGVPPEQLALEVTESALIRSAADVTATLSVLRESGIRLSVDDYGTGQSTLSYLKHLPVHELKIDKTFVTSLAHDENDRIMVRSTIDLAHELGLQVVAEGIEDGKTLDILREFGCDYAQGYFIGRPIAPDDFFRLASEPSNSRRVA